MTRRELFAALAVSPFVPVAVAKAKKPGRAAIHTVEFHLYAPSPVMRLALKDLAKRVGPTFRPDRVRYTVFRNGYGELMLMARCDS
jgi:hypothetical protein